MSSALSYFKWIPFSLVLLSAVLSNAQVPQLEWAGSIHGDQRRDLAYSVALDLEGNVYVNGFFMDTVDFDPGPSEHLVGTSGFDIATGVDPTDIFVQKLDSSGNFVWVRQFGGKGYDGSSRPSPPPFPSNPDYYGGSISVDNEGNIYIAGIFSSDTVDLDPGLGVMYAINTVNTGFSSDYMVVKIDSDGDFIWGHAFGGKGRDRVDQVSVDPFGDVLIIGNFRDTVDFDPSPTQMFELVGDETNVPNTNDDMFIQKLDSDGTLIWVKQVAGEGEARPTVVQADSHGNIYITGVFMDTIDFDPGPQVYELVAEIIPGNFNACFLLKLDANGNFISCFQIPNCMSSGAVGGDKQPTLTIDAFDNLILSARFRGVVDVDPSGETHLLASTIADEAFITKYSSGGNLVWAGQFIGRVNSLSTASDGSIYGGGGIRYDADADPGLGETYLGLGGFYAFRLDADGNLVWGNVPNGELLAGESSNGGFRSVEADESGNLHLVGSFLDTIDLDPSFATTYTVGTSIIWEDPFVAKWSQTDTTVGVAQVVESAVTVYPNPTSTHFTVMIPQDLQGADVHITDILGRSVLSLVQADEKQIINTEGWASGIYSISIRSDSFSNSLKLTKY